MSNVGEDTWLLRLWGPHTCVGKGSGSSVVELVTYGKRGRAGGLTVLDSQP